MSIENLLTQLIASLDANTAALGGAAKPAGKPAAKAADKPAEKAAAAKPAAKKGPTVDVIAKRFGEYLKTGSKDDRAAAAANVKAIIGHFDTDRITNLDPDNFVEALAFLDQFEAGEDPFAGGDDDGDGEDLM